MSSQVPWAITGLMFLMFLIIQFFRFRVADTEQYFLCFSSVSSTLFSCLWTSSTVPVAVLPSSTSSTLTEQSVSEDVSFSVPGRASQDFCVVTRLNAPSPGFDDNVVRYVNSPVTHDAVPAQHDPLLFLVGVPLALPAPTKIIRFFRLRNLTFKIGVVRFGNTVRRGMLHVERCSRAEHHHCWRQTPPLRGSVVATRLQERHEE